MTRFGSQAALVLALAGLAAYGCSSNDAEQLTLENNAGTLGTAALALSVPPDLTINAVTAVLTFPSGKEQEHTINVQPSGSTPTIYFRLPVANGYKVKLTANATQAGSTAMIACLSDAVSFNILLNAETPVSVPVVCTVPGGSGASPTGSVKVTGSFSVNQAGCDPILSKVVISPAVVTNSSVPVTLQAFPRHTVTGAMVSVTASAGNIARTNETDWAFSCGAATGAVTFTVSATLGSCSESGTIGFLCPGTASPCGNGQLDAGEACDGTVFPAGTPAGSTCNATCTVITPPPVVCGDGVISGSEICDTNGPGGDVLPAGTAAGSSCSANCTAIIPPVVSVVCGDGIIGGSEACDTNGAGADVLPAGTAAGSTCNATCSAIIPPVVAGSGTCQASCVEDLVNNGACNGVFSPVGTDSDAVIDCILGASWPAPNTFTAGSCANGNLLSCYCGTLTPSQCATALPADIPGAQCKNQILAGTGCDARPVAEQSTCVGQLFVNPGNAAGRALAYIQCLQDNCPDICFAP